MREDQIEYLKPVCQKITDKILVAIFGDLGVTKTSDIIPNCDEFLDGMVKSMYSEIFTIDEIDEVINFNKKFEHKNTSASIRSEQFIENYFKENQKVMEAMLGKFKGE